MAPTPVILLITIFEFVEVGIFAVPLFDPDAIRLIFVVVPLVIVVMLFVVVVIVSSIVRPQRGRSQCDWKYES